MIYLSVGNTFDYDLLEGLNDLNKASSTTRVTELFGSLRGVTPTARSKNRIPDLSLDWLIRYVQKASEYHMRLVWTLNANCVGPVQSFDSEWPKLQRTLQDLNLCGVNRFVISHPLIFRLVREAFPAAHLEVSTIAEVDTVHKIAEWIRLGANSICGKHSLNRDFTFLRKAIKECDQIPYRFILQEFCLRDCVDRNACYLASSHDSERGPFGYWPFSECSTARKKDPWQWIASPFILPQWIKTYQKELGLEDFYGKIVGRTSTTDKVMAATSQYFSGKYDGDLAALWPGVEHLAGREDTHLRILCATLDKKDVLEHFVQSGSRCATLNCNTCGYCKRIMSECVESC